MNVRVDADRFEELYGVCERATELVMSGAGSFGDVVTRAAQEKGITLTFEERAGLLLATAKASLQLGRSGG